ncbi:hypothetical protein [Dictyobacter alpinus]|uniref:hypothetical protein n=1 Tax=Dictyobacter alpinus TaxID=2014873 RepID=UPI000F84888E|nr:hypothetical protein [Dictyobacter alpinus]
MRAGLDQPWSQGQVEAQVHRLKLINSPPTPSPFWLVHGGSAGRPHLHRYHHRRFGCPASWTPRSHPLS